MLHEVVMETYRQIEEEKTRKSGKRENGKGFSVTSVSVCPYETYLHYHNLDPHRDKLDPLQILNMKNGWYQEQEMLDDLRTAGYKLRYAGRYNQMRVTVGKAGIPGHPDGLISTNSNDECMLECKALDNRRFQNFRLNKIEAESSVKLQVNLYMSSPEIKALGITSCWLYMKWKEKNKPYSFLTAFDPGFVEPVIDEMDKVALREDYVPRKEEIPKCGSCHHFAHCWGGEAPIDLSRYASADVSDAVEKWKEGSWMKDYGDTLVKESREVFSNVMGDKDELLISDLRVVRSRGLRTALSREKFVSLYGKDALIGVLDETPYTQLRVYPLDVSKI